MARSTIIPLTVLALTALTSADAFGQIIAPVGPFTVTNPPPFPYPSRGYDYQNEATVFIPQLFGASGLSNKAAGKLGCMAASRKTKSRPKVVATFPADGAVVRPGLVVVRVTFDQPMDCDASFDGTSDLPNPCPGRWREATLSQDRHSFRTVCEIKADMRYRLTLRSFHNAHGLAIPAEVAFSTSSAAPVGSVQQALAEDTGGPVTVGG